MPLTLRCALRALLVPVALSAVAVAAAHAQAGAAPVYEVRAVLEAGSGGACTGEEELLAYREELTGWLGRPGTVAARNAGDGDYAGTLSRRVTAAYCFARCPDGSCDGTCTVNADATGPAEVGLHPDRDAARLTVHSELRWTQVRRGGSCPDNAVNENFLVGFAAWQVPELANVRDLRVGRTLALEEEPGSGGVGSGTLAVVGRCDDPAFRPGNGAQCAAAAPRRSAR